MRRLLVGILLVTMAATLAAAPVFAGPGGGGGIVEPHAGRG